LFASLNCPFHFEAKEPLLFFTYSVSLFSTTRETEDPSVFAMRFTTGIRLFSMVRVSLVFTVCNYTYACIYYTCIGEALSILSPGTGDLFVGDFEVYYRSGSLKSGDVLAFDRMI
jgi:hypothetical protein